MSSTKPRSRITGRAPETSTDSMTDTPAETDPARADDLESGSAPTAASEKSRSSTLFRGKAWFWAPILPLLAFDLWSKAAVFAHLEAAFPNRPAEHRELQVELLPEPFHFSLVQWTNTGTIWGLGKGFTGGLMLLRMCALVLLVYFAWRTPATGKLQLLVLGMIMAGALGNLHDNLFEGGAVRDFLLFYYQGAERHVFPAFNVADSCICVGAFTLAFLLWRKGEGKK